MKTLVATFLTSIALSSAAIAAPTEVSFVAAVTFAAPGSPYAAIGPNVVGSYFFDYDPTTYTVFTNPGEGSHWRSYEYLGASYGLAATLPGLSSTVATGALGLGVYDDGSLIPGTGITGDVVDFGAKRNGVSYVLTLAGPNSTFSTTALPSAATLSGSWANGSFVVRDLSRNVVLQSTITELQVSAVPEPSSLSYALFGISALLALSCLRRREVDA